MRFGRSANKSNLALFFMLQRKAGNEEDRRHFRAAADRVLIVRSAAPAHQRLSRVFISVESKT
jgi:hypothetical protein